MGDQREGTRLKATALTPAGWIPVEIVLWGPPDEKGCLGFQIDVGESGHIGLALPEHAAVGIATAVIQEYGVDALARWKP